MRIIFSFADLSCDLVQELLLLFTYRFGFDRCGACDGFRFWFER